MIEMILWAFFILFIWTVASLVWLFNVMGYKYRKEQWYDRFLAPPTIVIAAIVAKMGKMK